MSFTPRTRKIRAIFKAKGQAWKPLCTNPPYGYVKDPEDKTHWIVNEEAAEVVRDIFRLYVQGYGVSQIANQITERHILNPAAHAMKRFVKYLFIFMDTFYIYGHFFIFMDTFPCKIFSLLVNKKQQTFRFTVPVVFIKLSLRKNGVC